MLFGHYASFADFSPMCLSVREPKVRCEMFFLFVLFKDKLLMDLFIKFSI
jgi:hypothetical protein